MEKDMDLEQRNLSDDLTQEKDISKQLQNHLNRSSSTEAQLFSGEEILRSNVKELPTGDSGVLSETVTHSAASDHRHVPRNRNKAPKWIAATYVDGYGWKKYGQKDSLGSKYPREYFRCTHRISEGCLATKQVQSSDDDPTLFEVTNGETSLIWNVPRLDGNNWRKYAQKDILGSKYPREYFRCTHRLSQGCPATKLVQRSNDDPSIFEVTCRGRHTCEQLSSHLPQQIEAESKEKPEKSEMVSFERILVVANFVLELPSAVFDQLSSVRKPLYAMILMMLSFAALVLCIVELGYQGRKKRVTWTRGNNNRNSSFSNVADIVGFSCAVCQSILTTANYVLLIQRTKIQIQISVWPVIFAFVLLCSKFSDETDKSGRERRLQNEV